MTEEWKRLKEEKRDYMKCAVCGSRAYRTYWEPKHGINPQVRQYVCQHGHYSYKEVKREWPRT